MDTVKMYKDKKNYYNSIPVAFCEDCTSLNIRTLVDGSDFCGVCGSTRIKYASIDYWLSTVKGEPDKDKNIKIDK